MLKFNLTQEGKRLISELQNNDKLAITHIRLLNNIGGNSSVDLPVRSGAVVIDGTCNGPYVVVDVNDASDKNYLSDNVALLSSGSEVATLYQGTNTSGYEVVLSGGLQGRNAYPSIKYRTQNWASKKIPDRVDIRFDSGDKYTVNLSFGEKGGDKEDPSSQPVTAQLTLGDFFPNTITFSNGDIWETNETVRTDGIKTNDYSYGASSGDGDLSIRPLYSKISIQKESNKQLKLRLSCQFDGAEKCKFNTTSINLPYASRFREGVVRFTDTSNPWISDGQKYNTVYSAADVDAKINQITSSLGNLDQYAKKAEANEFTAANTFTAGITVNGEINGGAVATTATANEKDTLLVSVGFANNKYLSKNEASTTYLTQTDASTIYITKTDANAAAANYAKLDGGNTFTGAKNTFQEVSATKFSGDGVSSDISADAENNGTKLPTCAAVATFVDSKTGTLVQNITELQDKDNGLQSQIDGINAGQNLADIVNNTTELAGYDVSHLKAKGDSLPGKPSTPLTIGDKVQVLGGGDAQSCVYELIKGTKPESEANSIQSTNNANYYWHYIGVYGTNAYTKAEIDTKVTEINSAIGTKADKSYVDTELGKKANSADVYSKTDADGKFAVKNGDNTFTGNNTFNGTIIGDAVTSDIATDAANQGVKLTTSTGVSSFVNTVVDNKITELNLDGSYLKLNSDAVQTVNSSVAFNGIITGNAIATRALESNGTRLPTEGAVVSFVNDKLVENRSDISDKTKVGAMGLFLYTGNDAQVMGAEVAGTLLQAVGMQLPMDGVVSWSQGAAMAGTWKLLNNTIAGEPCLVLAIRVG